VWLVMILPMLIALGASVLAWRHATRIDRTPLSTSQQDNPAQDQRSWGILLGGLVAAVIATMILQAVVLSRL